MTTHTFWHPPGNSASLHPEYSAAFRAWLDKPAGRRFIDLECQRMGAIIPTLFGYESLLIGEPNYAPCLHHSTIKNQFLINEDLRLESAPERHLILTRPDRLPIASSLIDLVYLAHTLEFASNPHEVLRETHRIMRADGHLLITMLNPLSLWGLWRNFAKLGTHVPWSANFMSIVKLKDWLALLGFDIMQVHYFGFNLPFNARACATTGKLTALERYGQKLELPFGAAYLIEASKRVIPLNPITPVWRAEPGIIEDDVTEPTV